MCLRTALIHILTIRTHTLIHTLDIGAAITAATIAGIDIPATTVVDMDIAAATVIAALMATVPATAIAGIMDTEGATDTVEDQVIAVGMPLAAGMQRAVDSPDAQADLRVRAGLAATVAGAEGRFA